MNTRSAPRPQFHLDCYSPDEVVLRAYYVGSPQKTVKLTSTTYFRVQSTKKTGPATGASQSLTRRLPSPPLLPAANAALLYLHSAPHPEGMSSQQRSSNHCDIAPPIPICIISPTSGHHHRDHLGGSPSLTHPPQLVVHIPLYPPLFNPRYSIRSPLTIPTMANINSDKGGSAAVHATTTTIVTPSVDSALAAVENNLRNVTLGDSPAAAQYAAALSTSALSTEAASASAQKKKTAEKIAISESAETVSIPSISSSPLTSTSSGGVRVQVRISEWGEGDIKRKSHLMTHILGGRCLFFLFFIIRSLSLFSTTHRHTAPLPSARATSSNVACLWETSITP